MGELIPEFAANVRNSYGMTAVVAFALATELGKLSDKLMAGSAICGVVAVLAEAVREVSQD